MPSFGAAQYAVTGKIHTELSAPTRGNDKVNHAEFADDGMHTGNVKSVIDAYNVVSATLAEDLGVENSKLCVYMPNASDDDRTLLNDAGAELVTDGLTWVGTPIGNDEYVAATAGFFIGVVF